MFVAILFQGALVAEVNLSQLVQRLNKVCVEALTRATAACQSRTNYNIEIEHFLFSLLDATNTDLTAILRKFDIDPARVSADVTRALDRLSRGSGRQPGLSLDLVAALKEAWLVGSLEQNATKVRSGHVLCALLGDAALARITHAASREFTAIDPKVLKDNLGSITSDTAESTEAKAAGKGGSKQAEGASGRAAAGPSSTPALDQYTIDLTELARSNRIDPVLGRDTEIRQIIDILTRRRQNNPILTGEAGVGKTAVVEGFALKVAEGDVPPSIKNIAIRSLDMGLLQAGAGVKGEFENRLKNVINEVKSSPTPIVLFIDEAHTLIGSGSGQSDAANLLKPALARGELRTIAATTWAEYKKYFEKDAALTRRFQVVRIEEPDEPTAVAMLRGLVDTLEDHHKARIRNDAVIDAVKLSNRYISGRQLPDKAVSLLDTTCARIGLSQSSTPPIVGDLERQVEQTGVNIEILEREQEYGAENHDEIEELRARKAELEAQLAEANEKWDREKELVAKIIEIERKLAGVPLIDSDDETEDGEEKPEAEENQEVEELSDEERQQLRAELRETESELQTLQGETPLVHAQVTSQAVAETVASWTGIPVGRMMADQIKSVLNLKQLMEESVVGQSHAMDRISEAIQTSRASLSDPQKPIGVFLLAGTSGVGKTETAITLAELLYGGEQNMTVINMSEFKEEHKVSLLMGSPPGYVGYGEGGVLTEAVRRKPYSVVLLDEMEKAHAGVQDIFYQVFDKGTLKDGEGRDINFKNTVIIMTTNAGTDLIKGLCSDPELVPGPDAFKEAVFPELLKTFKPAFLGRLDIVPYYPLNDEVIRMITRLKLNKIVRRVRESHKATLDFSDQLVDEVASRCTEVDTGARNIDHILTRTLLPELSREILSRLAEGDPINSAKVGVGETGEFLYEIS